MKRQLKWHSLRFRVLVIAILLVTVFGGYIWYRIHLVTRQLPMGTGPAGPKIASEAFADIWTKDEVVLIGVGDSITRGLGATKAHTYFELLQRNDNGFFPDMVGCDLESVMPNLKAMNYALDYTTSQEHIDVQLPRIPKHTAAVKGLAVVTSGGNDLIHDYGRRKPVDGAMYGCSYEQALKWTENVKGRVRGLLEGIMDRFDGECEIFLANIYDPTDGVGNPQNMGMARWGDCIEVLELMNSKIKELCDEYENVHLIDIHTEFLGHGFYCTQFWRKHYKPDDPCFWYYQNLEDPNQRGYDAIRRLFLRKMPEVLSEKWKE